MEKADGAFLTIGELARELDVPQHVLRYWETRFPRLSPLLRSGNRRYYRPRDVALAKRIHSLLNVEGFTIKGAQRVLREQGTTPAIDTPVAMQAAVEPVPDTQAQVTVEQAPSRPIEALLPRPAGVLSASDVALLIARLLTIRDLLQDALDER